ncbi:MAG: NAD-dependent epimerase/dehydratase family protein [Micavibrio sp.]
MKKILVTGAAGFIGFHLARRLCEGGAQVLGVDNLNDYYDVSLKEDRLGMLEKLPGFSFEKCALEDDRFLEIAASFKPDIIVNLAAQAGVRYSLENPRAYVDSNLVGFLNVLEAARGNGVEHLVFASSSSVYGANTKLPFAVADNVDHPVSLYAATKKANELMAHSYAHLYNIPCTGLRFFTVYGPWGRPDMAYFKFTKAIYDGAPVQVFNHGDMKRDFTYIDDVVEGVVRIMDVPPAKGEGGKAPYALYNIGNNAPEDLMHFIHILEKETGLMAKTEMLPMQPGDVYATYADVDDLQKAVGFRPATPLEKGLRDFVAWFRAYYKMGNGPAGR